VSYVATVAQQFTAERAISPNDGSTCVVVVDENFDFHAEATAYLAWLRSLDRSPNTERAYAGRISRFLTYCESARLDWRQVSVEDLSRYLRVIVSEPIARNSMSSGSVGVKFRTNKTANANLTAVCEFLRFAAARNWISSDIASDLSQPKYLGRPPSGYDWGENEQFREVRARSIVLREIELSPETLDDGEIAQVVAVLRQQRDRLLVCLLAETGMRIGEALASIFRE
jgi:integrase/recombinase XerD